MEGECDASSKPYLSSLECVSILMGAGCYSGVMTRCQRYFYQTRASYNNIECITHSEKISCTGWDLLINLFTIMSLVLARSTSTQYWTPSAELYHMQATQLICNFISMHLCTTAFPLNWVSTDTWKLNGHRYSNKNGAEVNCIVYASTFSPSEPSAPPPNERIRISWI